MKLLLLHFEKKSDLFSVKTLAFDKQAGAGLERVAPNLLLILVLQEYPYDVPTLFPTLSAETAPFDCAFTPDFQDTIAPSASPSAVSSDTNEILTERSPS